MERAAAVVGNQIGDIDERVDRAKPDRLQPPLQPFGRTAVLDAAHEPPGKTGQASTFALSNSSAIGIGLAKPPLTVRPASALSLPRPAAARSRAMPRTPRQSGRFGVMAM